MTTPPAPLSGRWRRLLSALRAHPGRSTLAGVLLLFILILGSVDALLAGPMRTWAERMMNAQLKGYTVHIGRARPHLWRMAFELDDLVLVQTTHPDPPVADFGALKFSMLFRELLRFKVAGDLSIERPALHINLAQLQQEAASKVSLKDRGWQGAVEAVFPIKLDRVSIRDGSLLYLSGGTASKPIHLTQISMAAKNVRNIAAAKGSYPSPVALEGVLFDSGKVAFAGAADFLREPYAAAKGTIHLEHVPLDRLDPLAKEYQLKTSGGFLSATGLMEYTPEAQTAHLSEVLLDGLRVDYVTSNATKAVEKEHAKQAVKLAKSVNNAPQLLLQVDTLKLTKSQIGFVNQGAQPPYRLFLADVSLALNNLSNKRDQGRSAFQARGAFMGSGVTVASGSFQSTASPADFEVRMQMDDAKLPALNNFLNASAGVDVAEGEFSVYTELAVKHGRVEGYIKPLIKNLKIYDKKKDGRKPFGKRVEMHVLQFFAGVFRNRSSKAVATVTRISGSTSDPKATEWEAIRKLFGNGLAHAIRPGFLDRGQAAPPKK